MSENKKILEVQNRSDGTVVYSIPDLNLTRRFGPFETKKVSYEEIEKLQYQEGGSFLIQNYLLIRDEKALEDLSVQAEPEYFYTEEEIKTLLTTGTLDQLADCLNFAPDGVIDILKTMAVNLPLNDIAKCELIKEKLDFDVRQAVENSKDAVITDAPATKTRKAAPVSAAPKTPTRAATPVKTNK